MFLDRTGLLKLLCAYQCLYGFILVLNDVLDCEEDHKQEDLFWMGMDTIHSLRKYFWCPCVFYQSIQVRYITGPQKKTILHTCTCILINVRKFGPGA